MCFDGDSTTLTPNYWPRFATTPADGSLSRIAVWSRSIYQRKTNLRDPASLAFFLLVGLRHVRTSKNGTPNRRQTALTRDTLEQKPPISRNSSFIRVQSQTRTQRGWCFSHSRNRFAECSLPASARALSLSRSSNRSTLSLPFTGRERARELSLTHSLAFCLQRATHADIPALLQKNHFSPSFIFCISMFQPVWNPANGIPPVSLPTNTTTKKYGRKHTLNNRNTHTNRNGQEQ